MRRILLLILTYVSLASTAYADLPVPKAVVSTHGTTAWVIEDHYLPIVSFKITFRGAGFAYDSAEKLGLASLVSGLLDEGAGSYTSFDYRKKLEELAASITYSADEDNFSISVTTLSDRVPDVLKLLSLVLHEPRFDQVAIDRVKSQIRVIIQKQDEDPENLASRTLTHTVFGDHPYGRDPYGTLASLDKLSRDDLLTFVRQHFTHDRAVISIVGDVSPAPFLAKLDDILTTLPASDAPIPALPKWSFPAAGKTVFIKKDLPQTIMVFALPGTLRQAPDFLPAYVMNYILGGGGFESRLMHHIREENGLAYTVSTNLDTMEHAGLMTGYVATKTDQAHKSLTLLNSELARMQTHGITFAELGDAKEFVINSFPLQMTQNAKLASFLDVMQNYNMGIDYLQKRSQMLQEITQDEADRTAYEILNPKRMVLVVIGKENP